MPLFSNSPSRIHWPATNLNCGCWPREGHLAATVINGRVEKPALEASHAPSCPPARPRPADEYPHPAAIRGLDGDQAWGCNLLCRKAPAGSLSLASSLLLSMRPLVPGPGVKSTPPPANPRGNRPSWQLSGVEGERPERLPGAISRRHRHRHAGFGLQGPDQQALRRAVSLGWLSPSATWAGRIWLWANCTCAARSLAVRLPVAGY